MESDDIQKRKFVVGLGNPGRKYAQTRHNIGFRVLEVLRQRWNPGEGKEAFEGLFWDVRPHRPAEGSARACLLAPMKYMNCSGRPTAAMLKFYKAAPGDLLVVSDDLALPLGQLRIRPDGSAGGHNGLEDVLRVLSTDNVPRLRVGIGFCPGVMDPKDYVLGKFRPDEEQDIGTAIQFAADAVEDWVFGTGDLTKIMEKYNRKL